MADNGSSNTGGSVAARAKREGGFRLSGGGRETAGGRFKSPTRRISGGGSSGRRNQPQREPERPKRTLEDLPSNVELTKQQKDFFDTLPQDQKDAFLISVASRRRQPTSVRLSPEQAEFQRGLSPDQQREFAKQVADRRVQPAAVKLTRPQFESQRSVPVADTGRFVKEIQEKSRSPDMVQRIEAGLGRDVNIFERSAVRFQQFTTPQSQKTAAKRTAQSFEAAGRRTLDVFAPGQPFGGKPAPATNRRDQLTDIFTNPAFIFGAPAVVATGAPTVGAAKSVLAKSQVGRFATGTAGAFARSQSIVIGSNIIGEATSPESEFVTSKRGRDALRKAFRAEEAALSQAGFARQFGSDISLLLGDKDAFEKSLESQGLKRSEIEAILRQRRFRGTGELLALVEVSRSAESLGRRNIQAIQKKGAPIGGGGFFRTAARAAPGIGSAGFLEGFTGTLAQQQARAQKFDMNKALGMGALGAGTAAGLGGIIGGLGVGSPAARRATKTAVSQRRLGKGVETLASIVDPFEKPGDVFQNFVERIQGRGGRGFEVGRTVSVRQQLPDIFNPSVARKGNLVSVRAQPAKKSQIQTKTKTRTNNFINTFERSQNEFRNLVPIPTRTDVTKFTETFSFNIPTPVEPIKTPANVPVTTTTPTLTPVPVVTPILRAPPPFFPPLGLGGGGSGKAVGRQTTKLVNELEASFNLIGGFALGRSATKRPAKKRGSKKK